MNDLSIITVATKGYLAAIPTQMQRVQSCLRYAEQDDKDTHVILVGDGSPECKGMVELYRQTMPDVDVQGIDLAVDDTGLEKYKEKAQLLIADLYSAGFTRAKQLDCEFCWTLESDVLPHVSALQCMRDMLHFDRGYYEVAACIYPSQGGGDFLCGRGTRTRQILPDWAEDERKVPAALMAEAKKLRKSKPDKTTVERLREIEKEIEKCPPKGNVWEMNAKQWRRRGWYSQAFPALGKGSITPTDWCGQGCNLMSRRALALADWVGYQGAGTQDLHLVWNCWNPNGVRICALPHCPADHVIRDPKQPGKYVLCQSFHEPDGEMVGHLRQRHLPFPV